MKGQISIDLILAIIITFVFAGAMQSVISGMNETQSKISVINHQKEIGNNIAEILAMGKSLEDGQSFLVKYSIPDVIVFGDIETGCEIRILPDEITITSVFKENQIASSVKHTAGIANLQKTALKCGDYLEIKK